MRRCSSGAGSQSISHCAGSAYPIACLTGRSALLYSCLQRGGYRSGGDGILRVQDEMADRTVTHTDLQRQPSLTGECNTVSQQRSEVKWEYRIYENHHQASDSLDLSLRDGLVARSRGLDASRQGLHEARRDFRVETCATRNIPPQIQHKVLRRFQGAANAWMGDGAGVGTDRPQHPWRPWPRCRERGPMSDHGRSHCP